MKPYITLTCNCDARPFPVIMFVDAIETINSRSEGPGSRIGVLSHNNGGWKVAESPEQILALIKQAMAPKGPPKGFEA